MSWPKIVEVLSGTTTLRVPVDSWAELKEAMVEFGPLILGVSNSDGTARAENGGQAAPASHAGSNLSHGDRTLLLQFLESADRGLLTNQLSQALGKRGKGIRPALDRWSRKVGLVTEENAKAFEAIKRYDGRGFRMVEHYRRTAASMLGKEL